MDRGINGQMIDGGCLDASMDMCVGGGGRQEGRESERKEELQFSMMMIHVLLAM